MQRLKKAEIMRRDFQWAYFLVLIVGILGSALPARAETDAQKPNDAPKGSSSDAPLSKKLDKDNGVIAPPRGVDPGMHQQTPAKTGDKMPVIIPPGEPGGDQSVQPK
jgi:hypothetical protein